MIISDESLTSETTEFIESAEDIPWLSLLLRLGCLTTTRDGEGGEWMTLPLPLPPPEDLPEIRECQSALMAAMLKRDMVGSPTLDSLLSGMLRQEHAFGMPSEQQCYDVATLALLFIETYFSGSMLKRTVEPYLCTMLNTWLKPAAPWTTLPGLGEAARTMFGDAWCALALPEGIENAVGLAALFTERYIGTIIYEARPPFLPGLCPAQDAIMSAPLPEDVGLAA